MRDETALQHRTGLPDTLRILIEAYPRADWERHPSFGPLTRFWLERHLSFREGLAALDDSTKAHLDGHSAARAYGGQLAGIGQMLLGELHGHHQIEDHHYFPRLAKRESRLLTGFELLDADHHALDAQLNAFATSANAALKALGERDQRSVDARAMVGAFHDTLTELHGLLDRHLFDEEELIVPVLLKYGEDGLH